MADVASRCQSQLGSFRIRELKDVLARLGLPKQGKKQILIDKIMDLINPAEKESLAKGSKSSKKAISGDEAIAIVDEQYRKLRSIGTDLSRHKSAKSASSSGYPSPGLDESRCPCGSSVEAGRMIQCDSHGCRIWQHRSCVDFPKKPKDGVPVETPPNFYCELCRISQGDPFCEALFHPLLPVKFPSSTAKSERAITLQSIDEQFTLSLAHQELLQSPNYDLQVWCVLLSDKVSFRMHWPLSAVLRVNDANVRVTNRPAEQPLGANSRDEGHSITSYTREGLNRLNMSCDDARPFCLGVRIIRRRSLEEVMDMIPNEKDGEPFDEAVARVRRCINGGGGQGLGSDDDGADSDLEIVAESLTVNLRCPMSGSQIKVAGRFKPCPHMGCFDLDTYVEMNQRTRKWQCPICLKNYSIEHLIIDPFFNRITNALRTLDEDVTEVELKADGSWRPKLEGNVKNGEPWSPSPAAAVAIVSNGNKSAPVLFSSHHVKIEAGRSSHDHGSLQLKWTPEVQRVVNGRNYRNGGPSLQVMPLPRLSRSSSATGSNLKVGEDENSVNQDASEKNTVSMDDTDVEFLSILQEAARGTWQASGDDPANGGDIIVLSDSDDGEDEVTVVGSSHVSMYSDVIGNGGVRFSEGRVPNDINGDPSRFALGLGQYEYYGSQTEAVALQHPPLQPTPVEVVGSSDFLCTSLIGNDPSQLDWESFGQSHTPTLYEVIDSESIDINKDGSPLQNLLPSQPARSEVQENLRDLTLPAEVMDNSWFSLSLGGIGNVVKPTPERSLFTTSIEWCSPISQPGVNEYDPHGLGSNGSSQHLMDSRHPLRGHFTADGYPFPVRPCSGHIHARRVSR
ncbi:E3 SUMO-protein ligase SIZ1 isoform X2 [Physcomitrium patens]|uniref:E3 SUMO-protein ligase SIZ1 n=1 Tax=Physcomitrium patens TaxID=3218 RepID=A0A7I4FH00_PHYPA|nr:E3 SUMO-protein ligase SIZ1-like isoform X2 [Physcomitrium patens]|eukprot:XP_024364528.1 E3 SUMO-protein ligase SIZ1-like isoform X2 [Physcomitrella patens]